MVDISRATTGVALPSELSAQVWQTVQETSAVAQLSQPLPLPGAGVTVDVITGDPTPEWTAETAEKTVSRGTVSSKVMQGYTLAVIVPFSNQFRRDKAALYQALVGRLPGAMAKQIDATILTGTAPGSNFDVLSDATAVDINGTGQTAYDNLVDLEADIADAGGVLNGYALSPRGAAVLRKVKDSNGLPLLSTVQGGLTDLLGQPVLRSKAVYSDPATGADVVGIAGDWSAATLGTVEAIQFSISDQATVNDGGTQINLWQRNMFAVRVEMELGFRVRDKALFRLLTGATTA